MRFGEILDVVVYGDQTAVITKHGKPVARLVRYDSCGDEGKTKKRQAKWYTDIIAFKKKLGERQRRMGIVDNTDAVELIRQIRNEEG